MFEGHPGAHCLLHDNQRRCKPQFLVKRPRPVTRQPSLSLTELLRGAAWYGELSEAAQRDIAAVMHERTVPAGATLMLHGDTVTHWCGVMEGIVKLSAMVPDGRAVSLGGLRAGSWFGESSLLHRRAIQHDAVALRHSRVALMPRDAFEWLMQHEPSFSRFLLHQLNERLHWFMGDFVAHRLHTADTLVARALLGLVHPFLHPGASHRLDLSQEELAHLAGLSRQRCNRVLNALAQAGLVSIEYGCISLIDTEGLCTVAHVTTY